MTTDNAMIAALLREREGCAQHGLVERVAAVDEQLRLHGYKAPADGKADPTSQPTPPKGRRARSTETT